MAARLPAFLFASLVAAGATGDTSLVVLAGGPFTVIDGSSQAYSRPAPGLSPAQLELFANGRQEFNQRWVVLPSIGGKWGRGPTSNGESCADCHAGNGRGRPVERGDDIPASMVVRLSVPGHDEHGGPLPHPHYGDQLQEQGELGRVPPEGGISIAWREHTETFADGSTVSLRTPQVGFRELAFGPLGADALVSMRIAPPVIGAGLLEAVPEPDLLEIAQQQKQLGFGGRPNYVWDVDKQATAIGRFGWKATQPGLRQQGAIAFLNDMGVTTSLFARENCPDIQAACRKRPGATVPEQADRPFGELVFFLRALGVPARREAGNAEILRGEKLFGQAQCAVCHVPELRIGEQAEPPLPAGGVIRPYTDMLLHDMGDGLADGKPEYRAGPRDWRTPPLWGIGLSATVNGNAAFLHDGRARSFAEAILWHGGEAEPSRELFRRMAAAEREALYAFLQSL